MTDERRETRFDILVISSDELWCKFVRNTLRRTDHVLQAQSLTEAEELARLGSADVIFFSNELVPRNLAELESFISCCPKAKIFVLCDEQEAELHLSRKHLAHLGIEVEERPHEGKGLRRLINHTLNVLTEQQ